MQEPAVEDHENLLFVQCCTDTENSLDDRAIDKALGVFDYRTRPPHRWHTEVEVWTDSSPVDAHEPRRRVREYVILSDHPRAAFDLLRPLRQIRRPTGDLPGGLSQERRRGDMPGLVAGG